MKNAIQYVVTVKAVIEGTQTVGKDWAVTGQSIDQASGKATNIYGWTPEIVKTVRKEIQIYEQTVNSLDMGKLVSITNNLL